MTLGRGFGHHDPRLGIESDHSSKGLMHRPAGEHLRPWHVVVGLLRPAGGQVRTDTNEHDQHRSEATLGSVAGGDALSSVGDIFGTFIAR